MTTVNERLRSELRRVTEPCATTTLLTDFKSEAHSGE